MGPDRRMCPPAPACADGQSHGKQPVIISVRTRSQYFPEADLVAGPRPLTRPLPPGDWAWSPCTSPVPPGRGGRPVGEHCRALGWSAMILAVGLGAEQNEETGDAVARAGSLEMRETAGSFRYEWLGAGIVAGGIPALSPSGARAPARPAR